MSFDLIDLLTRPKTYVCVWRDGELYVEPVTATSTATRDSTEPEPNSSNISVPASQSRWEKVQMRHKLLVVLFAIVAVLSHMPQASAAPGDNIGSAVRIVNLVTAAYATDARRLATGDYVRQDELIEVSTEGTGELRLRDDTKLALGPGSQLLLDEFVYNPDIAGGAIVLNLVKGTFRFITGIAAKPAYVIRTPTASITVRGTIFDAYVKASGLSWLLLIEGAIEVCNERDECRVHDKPGKIIPISADGDVGNPVKWASLPETPPFESAFPFVVGPPAIDIDTIFTPGDIIEASFPEGPGTKVKGWPHPGDHTPGVRPPPRHPPTRNLPPRVDTPTHVDTPTRWTFPNPWRPPTRHPPPHVDHPNGGHQPDGGNQETGGHQPVICKRRGGCGRPPTVIADPPRGHPPTICKRRGGCRRWNSDAQNKRDRIDRRTERRRDRIVRRTAKRRDRINRRNVKRAARANRRNAKRAARANRRNAKRAARANRRVANRANRRHNVNRGRRGGFRGGRRGRRH